MRLWQGCRQSALGTNFTVSYSFHEGVSFRPWDPCTLCPGSVVVGSPAPFSLPKAFISVDGSLTDLHVICLPPLEFYKLCEVTGSAPSTQNITWVGAR